MRFLFSALLTCALVWPLSAQQTEDLATLRERLAKQEKQIEELRDVLAAQQKLLDTLSQKPAAAQPATAQKITPAPQPSTETKPLTAEVAPLTLKVGGFVDLTSVYRSGNLGSGIGTAFSSIPFENTQAAQISEARLSTQNSRVSLKLNAKFGKQVLNGYLESDFLGNAPGGHNVTSHSSTMRLRLYWAQILRDKWEFLGGQSWSMLTPNRVGISPVPSDIFYTQNVDTNYQAGLVWTRAPQFRAVYHANKNWTAGISLENPEQYVGTGVVLPSFASSQYDNGSLPGIPNTHPDIIGKVAYDGAAGSRPVHIEAAGLFRTFRSLNPSGSASAARGYSGSLNANFEVAKNVRFVVSSLYGRSAGRYIFGLAPDAVVSPTGTVSPVRSASGVAGLEVKLGANSALYGYYGGVYIWRNFFQTAPDQYVGYGFPGAPTAANRTIQEATGGYTYTFWKNPSYGSLQLMTQYSYVTRSPWAVPAGSPRNAHMHMVFANLRYALP